MKATIIAVVVALALTIAGFWLLSYASQKHAEKMGWQTQKAKTRASMAKFKKEL